MHSGTSGSSIVSIILQPQEIVIIIQNLIFIDDSPLREDFFFCIQLIVSFKNALIIIFMHALQRSSSGIY